MKDKRQEVIDELKEWLEKPTSHENLNLYGLDRINQKLAEVRVPKSIINGFESLDSWYSNNFVFELLTKGKTNFKIEASANGFHILAITDVLADLYANQNPPYLLFNNVAYYLANCISEKWYVESEILIKIINKGLNTNLKGGLDFKPSAWFIKEMANKGYNIAVDYSKYNYPKNMEVYEEALNNWNTSDFDLLDGIITKLCDFHLSNASFGDLSDSAGNNDPMFLQFSTVKEFVYSYEILNWLSIREMIGLKNPEKFSHPLMDLALNKLPTNITPMPKNELFEKVLAKVKSQNP